MKKFTIIAMMFTVLTSFVYADSSLTRKSVIKDAEKNNYSLLARQDDFLYAYSLYTDKNGIFYFYMEESLSNNVFLYTESGQVTKEDVQKKMNNSESSEKIINKDYVVYQVYMGFFASPRYYYYVKTPKGNFYSISKFVKKIDADSDHLVDEL